MSKAHLRLYFALTPLGALKLKLRQLRQVKSYDLLLMDWKHTQRVLEHMGAHIQFNATLNASEEYCRLCLCVSPMCKIYLTKGHGAGGRPSVDLSKSTCPNLICFNYKSAAQSSKRSPCSNVPVICSLCPVSSPAVWTYSLHSHYRSCHRGIDSNL
jgi:hypothetical protein